MPMCDAGTDQRWGAVEKWAIEGQSRREAELLRGRADAKRKEGCRSKGVSLKSRRCNSSLFIPIRDKPAGA
jgi:hypothetical protein